MWHERYLQLAKLSQQYVTKVHELEHIARSIEYHVQESDRLRLREQNKQRYLKLLKDVEIPVVYDGKESSHIRSFKAGTLIDASICGNSASVYLDEDGDGYLYFPANILEMIELDDDEVAKVDESMIVNQG